jgi:hypothetical protein
MSLLPLEVKLNVPGYKYKLPIKLTERTADTMWVKFPFCKPFNEELKLTFGGRWNPEKKSWYIPNNKHTWFQLKYLMGADPYHTYKKDLVDYSEHYDPAAMAHQIAMSNHMLTRKHSIICGEMGVGKTLSAIMVMKTAKTLWGMDKWLWVGPKSGLTAVQLEFEKWDCRINPRLTTYSSLVKVWQSKEIFHGVIFDECSLLKTPSSQRSSYAFEICERIRTQFDTNSIIALMTGTPSPKDPTDWWNQCYTACPGFLREPDIKKLKYRLAVSKLVDNGVSGKFPKLLGWKDDERKCDECAQYPLAPEHTDRTLGTYHKYRPCKNEVAYLGERMRGLVMTKMKKDCLDLPDKRYELVRCPVDAQTMRIAGILKAKYQKGIRFLEKLRQLSDGFQYEDVEDGMQTCTHCHGSKLSMQPLYIGPERTEDFIESLGIYDRYPQCRDMDPEAVVLDPVEFPDLYGFGDDVCPNCDGTGEEIKYKREGQRIETPKDPVYLELLAKHEFCGRLVTYAGFTESVNKCCDLVKEHGWDYIKFDGKGWKSSLGTSDPYDLMKLFQDKSRKIEKIVFIGNAQAAGMALTLTESPSIVYYSNPFSGQARTQSEDRIHRPGMDVNLGATIYDIINLPTDLLILKNLKDKRKLELITMDEINACLM